MAIDGAFTVRDITAADRDNLLGLVQGNAAALIAEAGALAVPGMTPGAINLTLARQWAVAMLAQIQAGQARLPVSFDTATLTMRGAGLWTAQADASWELILVVTDPTLPRGVPTDAMTVLSRLNAYRACYHYLASLLPDPTVVHGVVRIGGTLDTYLGGLRLPGPLTFVDTGNFRRYFGTALQARSM